VARQAEWNRPIWWPLLLGLAAVGAVVWLAVRSLRRRERVDAHGRVIP
jgi:hypothetical protein